MCFVSFYNIVFFTFVYLLRSKNWRCTVHVYIRLFARNKLWTKLTWCGCAGVKWVRERIRVCVWKTFLYLCSCIDWINLNIFPIFVDDYGRDGWKRRLQVRQKMKNWRFFFCRIAKTETFTEVGAVYCVVK